ncbi:MAG TPA: feruloyl-CoA synthase [Xanthobacteraceae bacterium]|nr:feruloyl-CoA synthase [Xanthobacteraceae bacterium]
MAQAQLPTAAAVRPLRYAPVDVRCEPRGDGSYDLRCGSALAPHDPSLARTFRRAAATHPDRPFLAEREATGAWRTLTYRDARRQVDAVAQALIARGLSAERPVMILSGNAVEQGVLLIAGYTAGVPVAPVSVAYSLQSQDHAKLKHIVRLLTPGLVYVADTGPFAKALSALELEGVELVAGSNGAGLSRVTPFDELATSAPTSGVEDAVAATGPDTIAKFLFTSGSTGLPKAVINTHGMLAANQQALAQVWPFLADDELVLLDWLPWNHTFGGNHNFHLVLRHAGTLYIDAGRPVPGLIEHTVRNLREISPTIYFNVPAGYAALLPYLERDEALARRFFERLRLIFYAAASLPQDIWERLEQLSIRITGCRVPMTSAWGSTETAPLATAAHFPIERAGVIGVPVPGIELKLVPSGSKLEVRVRGPHVTPGYWRSPDLTGVAFDEEGFYRIGDAVRFADPDDPAQGLLFDGRIAEDFKLTNGTWVHVGALRVGALAAASPALHDAIVCGEGRDAVGLVAWPNLGGCRGLIGEDAPDDLGSLGRHPVVHAHVRRTLQEWNARAGGASMRIGRVLLLSDPPSIDANEITDKGYINQRAAADHRSHDIERLYAGAPHPDLVVIAD